MKLPRMAVSESTVKQTFSFKESTVVLLQKYKAYYEALHNAEINNKDMVEAMLTGFMADDKDFQKHLKKPVENTAHSQEPSYQSGTERPF